MKALPDFDRSFVTWELDDCLQGRFNIESQLSIVNRESNKRIDWYLLSGVLACQVLKGTDMIHTPSYLFQAAFSEEEYRIYRMNNEWANTKDTKGRVKEGFHKVHFYCPEPSIEKLASDAAVCEAVSNNERLAAVVEMQNEMEQTISFPVKHINIRTNTCDWQIETGPILIAHNEHTQNLLPAYIALNNHGQLDIAPLLPEAKRKSRFFQKNSACQVNAALFKITYHNN